MTSVRPPEIEFLRLFGHGSFICTCGEKMQTADDVRRHWDRGHMDVQLSDEPPALGVAVAENVQHQEKLS
jgi:hypothetical protein